MSKKNSPVNLRDAAQIRKVRAAATLQNTVARLSREGERVSYSDVQSAKNDLTEAEAAYNAMQRFPPL